MSATLRGHKALVDTLIACGADVNAHEWYRRTFLFTALVKGHEGCVLTPLGCAAISGYEGIVKILIEEGGASLDPRDRLGRTPLALALAAGHNSVVELLIEKGAELNT